MLADSHFNTKTESIITDRGKYVTSFFVLACFQRELSSQVLSLDWCECLHNEVMYFLLNQKQSPLWVTQCCRSTDAG